MSKLQKNGHVIETKLPREIAQLRAEGYREVRAPKPSPSKSDSK